MAGIQFEHFEDSLELLNPLKGFAQERQRIEVYRDPLLGHTSIYNPAVEEGLKVFLNDVDRDMIARLATEGAGHCVFCPERVAGVARFPDALIPGGVVRVGEAVAFPNLIAMGGHHSVAIVSRAHFLELHQLSPELIGNAWLALRDVAEAVTRQDPRAAYLTVHGNYLFPAGASLMHPHFQMLIGSEPYTHHARLAEACRAYLQREGRSYHQDLVEHERNEGTRYIAATGRWHWLAAFSPLGSNEIIAVHETEGDLLRMDPRELADLALGLSSTLRFYDDLGHLSFNYTLYARREPEQADGFQCLLRVMTRQNPAPGYRCDDFYLQKGLQTELMLHRPEMLAAKARPFFTG
jgi:UDPglucose--hexose-1-phosphate uridylyltransferase